MRWLSIAGIGLAVAGCEPTYIETSAEVDILLAQQRYEAACKAFKNDREHKLREYTAGHLAKHPEVEGVTACICDAIVNWRHGPYDDSVLAGVSGTRRDDLVACALPAFEKAEGEDRPKLVTQLADIGAPAAFAKAAELAKAASEPAPVRVAAVRALTPVRAENADILLDRLTTDPDPTVRAAVAEVFEGATEPPVVAAIVKAAREDQDGLVRAAALASVVKLKLPETDAMVCDAMMNDPDERVRDRAVRSFKGSKRDEALDCLERRLTTREDSPLVRESTLTAIMGRMSAYTGKTVTWEQALESKESLVPEKLSWGPTAIYSSPTDRAAKILCDNIGPFLRMYVGDLPVTRMEGADIVKYQNNRDYERSYECVQKAMSQGGYSCYGRYYLAVWMNDLGGKATKPTCAGMEMVIEEAE